MNFLLKNALTGNGKTNRIKKTAGMILLFVSVWILTKAAISRRSYTPYIPEGQADVFLYGDVPGVEQIYEKEYELWEKHYSGEGMRDLFLELPYYEAQLLNVWMHEDGDEILQEWYDGIEGTRAHVESVKDFYRNIKENCPETVFHGTDIGLRYDTSGERYLRYLEEKGETGSDPYLLAQACMEQGSVYSEKKDAAWREETMAQNFIREYDAVKVSPVMGIYADAHCDPRKNAAKGKTGSMAKQLQEAYGDVISYESVEAMIKIESDRMLERPSTERRSKTV